MFHYTQHNHKTDADAEGSEGEGGQTTTANDPARQQKLSSTTELVSSSTGLVISRDLSAVLSEVVVPNDVFGMPLRKDLIYRAYWFYRRALAGYDNQTQYNKWEWPGSNKKVRSQIRSGMARLSRRCAHTSYEGSFVHPIRPKVFFYFSGWSIARVVLLRDRRHLPIGYFTKRDLPQLLD